jgi:phospholipid-binding lipoprotein MlaA
MTRLSDRCRAGMVALLVALTLLGGCASTGNPRDPFEPLNRGIYHFNDGVDTVLLRPAAEVYRGVLPQFVRTGVSNFYSNINDVIVALNNLLQAKFLNAVSDVGRIVVNTTAGVLGVLDVATHIGLEKHDEDFGQTLGYWGIGPGPYLVIPLLGPSSVRDAIGRFVDFKTDPITYVDPSRDRNILWGVRFVNRRSELLETSKILETAALDPYEFLRDAYLQRRRNLVYDGSPPPDKDDTPDVRIKPRSEGPDDGSFPVAVDPGAPENSARTGRYVDTTPAREEAAQMEQAPVPAQPRVEADPPQPRVVRVWTSQRH